MSQWTRRKACRVRTTSVFSQNKQIGVVATLARPYRVCHIRCPPCALPPRHHLALRFALFFALLANCGRAAFWSGSYLLGVFRVRELLLFIDLCSSSANFMSISSSPRSLLDGDFFLVLRAGVFFTPAGLVRGLRRRRTIGRDEYQARCVRWQASRQAGRRHHKTSKRGAARCRTRPAGRHGVPMGRHL